MSMNDPIADLLTRIRNAVQARQNSVDIPASRLKIEICRVLKAEGYINDYEVQADSVPGLVRVQLKYLRDRSPVLRGLKRVSKPSLRVYAGCKEKRQVMSGLGICIVTTSQGVMTGSEARKEKVGGEVICEVW